MGGRAKGENLKQIPHWAGSPTLDSVPRPTKIMTWAKLHVEHFTETARHPLFWGEKLAVDLTEEIYASHIASDYIRILSTLSALCLWIDSTRKSLSWIRRFISYDIQFGKFASLFQILSRPFLSSETPMVMHTQGRLRMGPWGSCGLCSRFFMLFFHCSNQGLSVPLPGPLRTPSATGHHW